MSKLQAFREHIEKGYTIKGEHLVLGCAMFDHQAIEGLQVKAPLRMFNRHGLVAGATGTGKSKTLQMISEGLSEQGVPVLLMDIKGDMSGLAMEGSPHPKITDRHQKIGKKWQPSAYPVELLTISNEPGARMRATISEFGPVLLSKMLELNENQQGLVALAFKFADDRNLPILDIKDFRAALQHISGEGKEEVQKQYGLVSSASVGTVLRKLLELEQQGADLFFGERSFDVDDLVRLDAQGQGYINILRLVDIQTKPKLFSTFMLALLAEIYEKFPERGDMEKPELVIFIDEAHLVFSEASKSLLNQIESIIKLIRSKGVGIFFCTQVPSDVPNVILSQLGMKVQHSLRAFTAKDRKDIKLAAENYPLSPYYKTDELLTSLGTGEALVSVLNEKGHPTPLVHCLMCAPQSRMDVLNPQEIQQLLQRSLLAAKYNETIDRDSAFEMLQRKFKPSDSLPPSETPTRKATGSTRREPSTFETVMKSPVTTTILREVTRGLLGVLGITPSSRRASTRRR